MSDESKSAAAAALSNYERTQVRRISAWKSEPPNAFGEMFRRITLPGARAAGRFIPAYLVRESIDKGLDVSRVLAGKEDLKIEAGVRSLGALKESPLEVCDALAEGVCKRARVVSAVEGAATGAAGPLLTLIDIPLLLILSLRTIFKVGHCYGYPLDRPKDRRYVLGALVAALSGSLPAKHERLERLRKVEDWLLEETEEEVIADEVASLLFQLEVFEEVPGVGAASGALLNLAFIRRVEVTARRVFQERWLRDNGKVVEIAPDFAHPRASAPGWVGALRRGAYLGSYYAGFGLAMPVSLLASRLKGVENPLTRGLRDGSDAAGVGADHWIRWASRKRRPEVERPGGDGVTALSVA